MDIDLNKPEVEVEGPAADPVRLSSNALRGRIRQLVSSFMMKPEPLPPTDADIINEYLNARVAEFGRVNLRIVELEEELAEAPAKAKRRLSGSLEEARARRMEIISQTVSSDDFAAFRSERKAAFKEARSRHEDEAMVIQELRPFLGMPHLPDIEANALTAEVILSVLTGISKNAPMKGQMVLMLDENIYSKPQFFPRSAIRAGIAPSLKAERGAGTVRSPFSANERYGVEAVAQGAFERRSRVYFKLEENRPLSHASWPEIDRYLPFAARSISVPLMPLVYPLASGFDFGKVFGDSAWRTIEEEILDRHASTCMVCGGIDKVKVHPRWRFREPVKGIFSPGVQQLDGFMTMCFNCEDTLRPSLDSLLAKTESGYVLQVDKERAAWMRIVNRWNDVTCRNYPRDAYLLAIESHRRRSLTNWIIDLSLQRSVFFTLEEGFSLERNGWIWPSRGAPFKVVGAPFYDRERIRNFFQKPSIFDVPWNSTLDDVSSILKDFDMAVVDEGGQGYEVDFPRNPVPDYSPDMEDKLEKVAAVEVESVEVDGSNRPTEDSGETDVRPSPSDEPSEDGEYDYDEDDEGTASPDYHERYASS